MTDSLGVEAHSEELERIGTTFPHTIRILPSGEPVHTYPCFVYAMNLAGDAEYVRLAYLSEPEVCAGPDAFHWLADNGRLVEIETADAVEGDLVVYAQEGKFTHIGILGKDGRVRSKWGTGNLYEHAALEVPSSYGQPARFFRPLTRDEAMELMLDYAEAKGVRFETD
jgi:hypothetical protein